MLTRNDPLCIEVIFNGISKIMLCWITSNFGTSVFMGLLQQLHKYIYIYISFDISLAFSQMNYDIKLRETMSLYDFI